MNTAHHDSLKQLDGSTNSVHSQLSAALNEYMAALEQGAAPSRDEFLDRFPEIRDELLACLEGLEFIHVAGRRVVDESASGAVFAPIDGPGLGQLGDFRLLRELGRGGMGIVYEAEQISLGRRVALKVLPFAAMLDPTRLQRFHLEAHAAASLDHPHIVPVYFVGQDRGVHYYAMRLIEGQSLAEMISLLRDTQSAASVSATQSATPVRPEADTQPLAALTTERSHDAPTFFRSAAKLGIQAAEALEHAHRTGMIHRDVKPSNMLLSSDARLWVADFGLAQVPDATDLTLTGDLIGTLRYMSPEQANGQALMTDHRTDIYSLGATLYELLTLHPVHAAVDRPLLLKQITTDEPKPPRQWNKLIPVDLETIVLKALSKDPHDRYATSQEMADDLRRFLEHHAIRARRPTLLQRATKWTRRHVTALLITVAILLCAVIGLSAGVFVVNRALSERSAALARSERNLALALDTVNDTYQSVGTQWLSKNGDLTLVQRSILEKSLKTYEAIVEQADDNPTSQIRVGQTYRRMANIHRGLRDDEAARACYARAIEVQSALVARHPGNDDYRLELSQTYNNLGILLRTLGQWRASEEALDRCQQELAQVVAHNPADLEMAHSLISCAINRAALWSDQSQYAEAEGLLTEARSGTEQLASSDKLQHRIQWLTSSGLLASLIQAQGRATEAEPICTGALQACEQLGAEWRLSDSTDLIGLKWQLVDTLGDIFQDTGRFSDAESAYREALKLKQQILPYGKTPREFAMASMAHELDGVHLDPMGEHQYAYLLRKLASSLGRQDKLPDAETVADEAARTDLMLAMLYEDAAQFVEGAARALDQLALLQLRQQKLPEARHSAEEAVAQWRKLAHDVAESNRYDNDMSVSLGRLCWVLAGRQESEVKDIQQAAELAAEAVRLTPDRPNAWLSYALAQYRAGRLSEARIALDHVADASPMTQRLKTLLTALARYADGEAESARQDDESIATEPPDDRGAEESVWLDLLRSEVQTRLGPQNESNDAAT